jgi:hypothetical protein
MKFSSKLIIIVGSIALGAGLLACGGADGEGELEGEETVGRTAEALKVVCTAGQSATAVRHDNDARCTGPGLTGSYISYYCGSTLVGGACEKRYVSPTQ